MSKGAASEKSLYKYLHETFDYKDGQLIYKKQRSYRRKVGEVAGSLNSEGYRNIWIKGKSYKAHRLIWFFLKGYFPEHYIDHINRNKADNRIENLREVNPKCNAHNCNIAINNTSGITGVSMYSKTGKWYAQIMDSNGKYKNLGYYDSKYDAACARYCGELQYGYVNCQTDSSAMQYIRSNYVTSSSK